MKIEDGKKKNVENVQSIYLYQINWVCRSAMMLSSMTLQLSRNNSIKLFDSPEEADFIVINSCIFDSLHEEKTIKLAKKLQSYNARIIMIGCLASVHPDYMSDLDMDIVSDMNELPEALNINAKMNNISPVIDSNIKDSIEGYLDARNFFRTLSGYDSFVIDLLNRIFSDILEKQPLNRKIIQAMKDEVAFDFDEDTADIEISRGCNFNCAYCIIKKARGALISRNMKEILSDIRRLKSHYSKFRLVSDDCGSYGLDIGSNFPELMRAIHKEFPYVNININYIHPYWFKTQMKDYDQILKKMHITEINVSAQHFSQRVLNSMNRPYYVDTVIHAINHIRRISPKTTVIGHLLIGYPTENIIDFIKVMVNTTRFDVLLKFRYTPRKGTASYDKYGQRTALLIDLKFKFLLAYHRLSMGIIMIKNILTGAK